MQGDLLFNGLTTVFDEQGTVAYQADFLDHQLADQLFTDIKASIRLQQEAIQLFGQSILQPRLTAWVADEDIEYQYSGLNSPPQPWVPGLAMLKDKLASACQQTFNGVLCNYYRHGHDYMGWHSDNEDSLGQQPLIASLSLGADRRFDLRKRGEKSYRSITLQHGSLLVMSGDLQQHWQHRLPKQTKQDKPRLNLTYRLIKT